MSNQQARTALPADRLNIAGGHLREGVACRAAQNQGIVAEAVHRVAAYHRLRHKRLAIILEPFPELRPAQSWRAANEDIRAPGDFIGDTVEAKAHLRTAQLEALQGYFAGLKTGQGK